MNEELLKGLYTELGGENNGSYEDFLSEFKNSKELQTGLWNYIGGESVGPFDQFIEETGINQWNPTPVAAPATPSTASISDEDIVSGTAPVQPASTAPYRGPYAPGAVTSQDLFPWAKQAAPQVVQPTPKKQEPAPKKQPAATAPTIGPQFGVGRSVVELQVTDEGESTQNAGQVFRSGAPNKAYTPVEKRPVETAPKEPGVIEQVAEGAANIITDYFGEEGLGFVNAVRRGLNFGGLADILALGRTPTKEEMRIIAQIQKENQIYKPSKAYEEFINSEGFDAITNFAKDPFEILSQLVTESLVAQVRHGYSRGLAGATMGAGIGATALGAGIVPGAGLGFAAGMGLAGLNLEMASSILESLQEAGIDTTNEASLEEGFSNEELMSKARSFALKRGVPIAIFDALSAGVAGKFFAKPAMTLAGKLGKGAAEVGTQMGFAAAGETAAQVASGQKINTTAILAEALGEVGGGLPEIVVGTVVEAKRAGAPLKDLLFKANLPKQNFEDMIDISEGAGQLTPQQADEIKQEYAEVVQTKDKIPNEYKDNKVIFDLLNEREFLMQNMANADPVFVNEYKAKIDEINNKIQEETVKQKEQAQTKEAATKAEISTKKAYDFDDTLFDNKTGKLTKLGEDVKKRIEAGEDIVIVTARGEENINQIQETLGIGADKIEATGDEKKKTEALQKRGISPQEYYDADRKKLAAIQGVAAPSQAAAGVTKEQQAELDKVTKRAERIQRTLQEDAAVQEEGDEPLLTAEQKKILETELQTLNQRRDAIQKQAMLAAKKVELPEEIASLDDNEVVTYTVATLDEVPAEFRDRAKKTDVKAKVRKAILGIPIGKETEKIINKGYRYSLTGKELKDYAIQKQSTAEVPVQPGAEGRPGVGGQVQAKPEGPAGKGKGKGKEGKVEGEEVAAQPTPAEVVETPIPKNKVRASFNIENAGRLKTIQTTPAFKNIFSEEQLKNLKVGENTIDLNMTAWGKAQRMLDAKDVTKKAAPTPTTTTTEKVSPEAAKGINVVDEIKQEIGSLRGEQMNVRTEATRKILNAYRKIFNYPPYTGSMDDSKAYNQAFDEANSYYSQDVKQRLNNLELASKYVIGVAEDLRGGETTEKASPEPAKAPQKPNTVQGFEITRKDGSKLPASDYTKDKKTGKWKRVAADGTTKGVSFAPYVKQLEDALSSQSKAAAETKKTEPTLAKEENIANELAKANNISKTQAKTLSAVINTVKKNIAKRLGISLPEYRRRTAIRVVPNLQGMIQDFPNSLSSLKGLSSQLINDFTGATQELKVAFQDAFGKVDAKFIKNNGIDNNDFVLSSVLTLDNNGYFDFLGKGKKLSSMQKAAIQEELNNRLSDILDKAKNTNDFYIKEFSESWLKEGLKRAATENEKDVYQAMLDGDENLIQQQLENIQSQQRANLLASLNYLIPSKDYSPEFKYAVVSMALKGAQAKPITIKGKVVEGKLAKRNDQTVGNHQELSSMVLPNVYAEMQRGSGSHPMELIDKHTDKSIIGRDETWELVKDRVFKKADGGYWIKFEQSNEDSDIQALTLVSKKVQKVMAPDDNPWCTGGGMAATYLPKGDFYLFLNENLDPQITVRYEGNKIAELRGTDKGQALSESQTNIAEKFLDDIPNGNDYKNQVKASRVYHKLNNDIEPTSLQDLKDFFDVWGVELDTYDDEKIEKFEYLKKLYLNTYVELNEKFKLYDVIKRGDIVFKYDFVTKDFAKENPDSPLLKQKMLILGDINFYGFSDRFLPEGLEIKGSVRLTGSIELPKNLKIDGSLLLTGEEIPFGFTLPKGLQVGKDLDFENTTLPQGFTLPEGLKVGRDLSFYGAILPQGFTLPKGLQVGRSLDFGNTTLPQGFTLPEGLQVGVYLGFYGATLPQGFTLPEGLKVGRDLGFSYATLPQGFKLPEDLKVGGALDFSYATLPQGFTLPEGLKVSRGLIFIDAKYTDGTSAEDIFKEWENRRSVAQQDSRGAIVETPTSTIILLDKDNADVTTPIHEIAHEYEKVLTADERKVMEDWSGAKFGTTKFREAFAKGAERYLYEGATFNGKVDAVFEKLKNWFKKVITDAINYFGDINQLTPEVREVYSKMLIDGDMDVVEVAAPSQAAPKAQTATAETVLEPIGKTSAEREKQIEKFFTAAAGKDKAESSQMAKLTNNIWNSVAKFFGARNAQTANQWIQSKVALIGKTTTTEAGKLGTPRFQVIGEAGAKALDKAQESNVRLSNLTRAKEMKLAGKTPKEIRFSTGWEMGSDNKWRYEITPDIKVNFNLLSTLGNKTTDLNSFINFKELKQAYPSIFKDVNVRVVDGQEIGEATMAAGKAKDGKLYLVINKNNVLDENGQVIDEPQFLQIISHELQHLVSDIEGFPVGGNLEVAERAIRDDIAKNKGTERGKRLEELYSNKDTKENLIFDYYLRIAGEVEARNIENRFSMSPEERRRTLLQETEDVLRKDQITIIESFDNLQKQLDNGNVQFQAPVDNPYTFAEAAEAVANNLITEIDRMIKDRSNLANIKKRGFTKSRAAAQVKELKKIKEDLLQAKKDPKWQVDAYHGTPYVFDKFSTEKIGTGEGAQAFGWGLYFTDLESIARSYADKLTPTKVSVDGNIVEKRGDFFLYKAAYSIADLGYERAVERYNMLAKDGDADAKDVLDAIEQIKDKNVKFVKDANIYKTSLFKGKKPGDYTLLEWDKRIDDATFNKIKNAIEDKYGKKLEDYDGTPILDLMNLPAIRGGSIMYKTISRALKGDKNASLFLLEAGIDGVKYPAESISRGATADTARGFNYVIFDENDVAIEERVQFQQDAAKFRAAVITTAQNKLIVAALESPNASSFVHEGFHMFEGDLTADEKQTIIDSYNDSFGEKETEFTTDVSEWGARMWEKYFSNGRQLTAAEVKDTKKRKSLQEIFDKFTEWLKGVYEGVINYTNTKGVTREVNVAPEVQALFDNIMGITPSQAAPAGAQTQAKAEAKAETEAKTQEAAKEQEKMAKDFNGNKVNQAANNLILDPDSVNDLSEDLLKDLYDLALSVNYSPKIKKKC